MQLSFRFREEENVRKFVGPTGSLLLRTPYCNLYRRPPLSNSFEEGYMRLPSYMSYKHTTSRTTMQSSHYIIQDPGKMYCRPR